MRDDEDEVLAESKKPVLLTRRGTSYGVNIPTENLQPLRKIHRGKLPKILLDIHTFRGKDGGIFFVVKPIVRRNSK